MASSDWHINQTTLPEGRQQLRMVALYEPLAREVTRVTRGGYRPVSIAGDCCAALGVATGLQRAGVEPLLIWFDAHGDFNTWETSPSGFLGGMPLAMLVGRGEQTIPKALGLRPTLEKRILLTDARDLDAGEEQALGASQITHLTAVENLINYPVPPDPIHLHLDVDVLDPTVAPAVDYPALGGPNTAQMGAVFRFLSGLDRIVAISVSTWNPQHDKTGQTAKVCLKLLETILSP